MAFELGQYPPRERMGSRAEMRYFSAACYPPANADGTDTPPIRV